MGCWPDRRFSHPTGRQGPGRIRTDRSLARKERIFSLLRARFFSSRQPHTIVSRTTPYIYINNSPIQQALHFATLTSLPSRYRFIPMFAQTRTLLSCILLVAVLAHPLLSSAATPWHEPCLALEQGDDGQPSCGHCSAEVAPQPVHHSPPETPEDCCAEEDPAPLSLEAECECGHGQESRGASEAMAVPHPPCSRHIAFVGAVTAWQTGLPGETFATATFHPARGDPLARQGLFLRTMCFRI